MPTMISRKKKSGLIKSPGYGSVQIEQDDRLEMKKQINLFHCVSIIIGCIIGSGIFVSPVGITRHVRTVGMSITMWAVSGLFSMMCALCYAELGACIPESGGEYIYIKRAWGDFAAFMCLWMNYIIINPVGVAAASLIFSTYILRPFFPGCDPPVESERILAALVIALIVAVNCLSVELVTKIQAFITCSKVASLIAIIAIGFTWLGKGNTGNFKDAFEDSDYSAGAISISFYSGFWAFGGWNYLNFLSGEVINPNRNLPLGIMISMTAVIIIYIAANIAYFTVLTPTDMLASSAVAVTFLGKTVSPLAYAIPILIAISVVGGMNGAILAMSRLFFVAAKNNHLPVIISMLNVKNLTPVPSLITMFFLVIIMQTFGNIFFLIEMMGFCVIIVIIMVLSGLVKLRWTEPKLHRPIKVPSVLPIVLCCVTIAILGITIYQKPEESSLALAIIFCGIPAYLLGSKWKKPASVQKILDGFTIFLQKLFMVSGQEADADDTYSMEKDIDTISDINENILKDKLIS